ncbi:hypothetical protein JWG42_11505 [Desulfoprunum benzoelyticum]|uniref:Uncharacterized protein n=1 Tax=Desulfoprunum benzoelyticum TaxID=1506996 RepID=A0A840UVV5_9BACT|nr:hypothetical protein [Desulfoprunum benzoelyticum]MBB5348973.1 hypothetical protein [Desulfoprunum benzoelyticum]MBM9530776.1 hypothetical protein [Desulfoprunum benzoelyticum]
MLKATTSTRSIVETPIAERPLAYLLDYGSERQHADLFESLRGMTSLLRVMIAAIEGDENKCLFDDDDLSELLFILYKHAEQATTAADSWKAYEEQVKVELSRRTD